MSELGDLLKARREGLNKSYVNVRDAICINPKFIQLIEEGRFSEMPSYLHSFGFVKKYSQYLGFNYDVDIKPLFDKECPKDSTMESENVVVPHIDSPASSAQGTSNVKISEKALQNTNADKVPFSSGRVVIIAIIIVAVAVLLGFGIYYIYNNNINKSSVNNDNIPAIEQNREASPQSDSTADMNESIPSNEVKELEPIQQDNNPNIEDTKLENNGNQQTLFAPINTINTEPEKEDIVLPDTNIIRKVEFRFNAPCWVQYTSDTGESKELSANNRDRITITFTDTFSIVIGNAAAVSMVFDGKTYSRFGAEAKPRRLTYKFEDGELRVQG